MELVHKIEEVRSIVRSWKKEGLSAVSYTHLASSTTRRTAKERTSRGLLKKDDSILWTLWKMTCLLYTSIGRLVRRATPGNDYPVEYERRWNYPEPVSYTHLDVYKRQGHQLAALATYPELGCTGGPYDVWGQWGVADDVICAGNEKSMQFLDCLLYTS